MYGYYKSVLLANAKKKRLYILPFCSILLMATIAILVAIFGQTNNINSIEFVIWSQVYFSAIPLIIFFMFILMWFMFYKSTYSITNTTNIEIISFSSGLTRNQIFFVKFFNHLTLSTILTGICAILIAIFNLSIYKIDSLEYWMSFLGVLGVGIIGSMTFFMLMFLMDLFPKKPMKFKQPLGMLVIFGTFFTQSFIPIIPIILNATVVDKSIESRGLNIFDNNKLYNSDLSTTLDFSTTDKKNYIDEANDGTFKEKERNFEEYQNYTQKMLTIHKSIEMFDFYKVVTKNVFYYFKNYSEPDVYNYHQNANEYMKEKFNKIVVNRNNKQQNYYLKADPWFIFNKYNKQEDKLKIEKFVEDNIKSLVEKLKTNEEFQKSKPSWIKLYKFLQSEIEQSFASSSDEIVKESFLNFDKQWLESYIYVKAIGNEVKELELPPLYKVTLDNTDVAKEILVYEDENGSKFTVANDVTDPKYGEWKQKARESDIARGFNSNFVNANEVVAFRTPTRTNDLLWVNWVLMVVIILGAGYLNLYLYNKKDVA